VECRDEIPHRFDDETAYNLYADSEFALNVATDLTAQPFTNQRHLSSAINPLLWQRRCGLCKNRNWDRHDAAELPHRNPDKLIDSGLTIFCVFGVCRVSILISYVSVKP